MANVDLINFLNKEKDKVSLSKESVCLIETVFEKLVIRFLGYFILKKVSDKN